MGVSVLNLSISQNIRTETVGRNKIPIAVGENCIYFLKYVHNPRVIKVDLKNQTTSISNNFVTEFGYSDRIMVYPFAIGRKRNGDLCMDCLVIDFSETEGSRNLYLRRFIVDPTDLTLSARTQRTLSGSADLSELGDWWRFASFGHETLITEAVKTSTDKNYAIKVDLHGMRYHVVNMGDSDINTKQRWFCAWMLDRTTNTPYYFVYLYGTWVPGSHGTVGIYDVKTLQKVATSNDYDPGCGGGCAPNFYRDSNDKVRYYHVGNSGASESYTSHFGAFYVDNGSIVVEAEHAIDSTYKDYSGGNTTPIPLGITSDNKIAWMLICSCWKNNSQPSVNYSEGFQLITTNDTFGSPTKVASATYNITTSDYIVGDERRCVFLWEDDWCYYAPSTIIAGSPNDTWKWGKLDLSGTGITMSQDDPYGTIIVPKSGLLPTTLTLTVTKV